MSDERLIELALRWEELRDQGQAVAPEALCLDCPELLDPLRRRIHILQRIDAALEAGDDPTRPQPPSASSSKAPAWPTVPGYEILWEPGRGGMGVVYKARQISPGRIVALKMILPSHQPQEDDLVRFRREVEAIASLQHPNLVGVYEVGEHQNQPFFSLEYMAAGSLDRWINGRPQPPRQAAEMVETLARALHVVHGCGIVHRDIKPANILLQKDESSRKTNARSGEASALIAKISDFGLARRLDGGDGPTLSGAILGTPAFMAPEQASGKSREVGPAADIYGLGGVLYNLLTGRPAFQADASWDILHLVLSGEVVSPRRLQPGVPADLDTICLKCLEKDSRKRYATALDLADDLHRFLEDRPIQARPIGPVGRTLRWSKRRPAVAALLGVIFLAVGVIVSGGVIYNIQLRQALHEATESAEQNRQGLVRLHVAQGARLLDEGDNFRALVWFAEALRLEEGRPQAESSHRIRLAATLRQCPRLIHLWSDDGPVTHVSFSPNGQYVLTVGKAGVVRMWHASSGKPFGVPLSLDSAVKEVVFPPAVKKGPIEANPAVVATASADGKACVWEIKTGLPITPALNHSRAVNTVAFSPGGERLITAGEDGIAQLWDSRTGAKIGPTMRHDGPVRRAEFSPDGRQVVTASVDQTARVWQTEDGRECCRLRHDGPVADAVFAPDGRCILTASEDGAARLWDVSTGMVVRKFRHRHEVVQARFSPDGARIITASEDHTACVWDAATGEPQGDTLRHASSVTTAVFSPDGRLAATGGDDNAARVWGAAAGEPLTPLLRHNGSVNSLAFSPDGLRLATAGNDHFIRLWDLSALTSPYSRKPAPPDSAPPSGKWLSGNGRWAAVVEDDQTVRVRDAMDQEPLGPRLTHGSTVRHAAFSPDGRRLITSSDDNSARIWDWAVGRLDTAPLAHNGGVRYGAFSPDGRLVVTVCVDGTARVWEPGMGSPLTPALRFPGVLERVAFDPEGTRLTLTSKGLPPLSWDLRPARGPASAFQALAQLLSGSGIDAARGLLPIEPDRLQEAWETPRFHYRHAPGGEVAIDAPKDPVQR